MAQWHFSTGGIGISQYLTTVSGVSLAVWPGLRVLYRPSARSSRCGLIPPRSAADGDRGLWDRGRRPACGVAVPAPGCASRGLRPRVDDTGLGRLVTLLREHYALGQLDLDELDRRGGRRAERAVHG